MPDLSAPAWPADRLVFLNDVFFCAGDLIRLLQHDKSDMACGMDFVAWKSPPSTNDIQPYGPYGPPLSVYHPACAVPRHLPDKPYLSCREGAAIAKHQSAQQPTTTTPHTIVHTNLISP